MKNTQIVYPMSYTDKVKMSGTNAAREMLTRRTEKMKLEIAVHQAEIDRLNSAIGNEAMACRNALEAALEAEVVKMVEN